MLTNSMEYWEEYNFLLKYQFINNSKGNEQDNYIKKPKKKRKST